MQGQQRLTREVPGLRAEPEGQPGPGAQAAGQPGGPVPLQDSDQGEEEQQHYQGCPDAASTAPRGRAQGGQWQHQEAEQQVSDGHPAVAGGQFPKCLASGMGSRRMGTMYHSRMPPG